MGHLFHEGISSHLDSYLSIHGLWSRLRLPAAVLASIRFGPFKRDSPLLSIGILGGHLKETTAPKTSMKGTGHQGV